MKIQAAVLALAMAGVAGMGARLSTEQSIDTIHSGVNFHVVHQGISWIPGRFQEFSGDFHIDADPTRSSFRMSITAKSIDTNNEIRDKHLRNEDFFDVDKYPTIDFASKAVELTGEGYSVTGDLNMHGKTRPVTFILKGGKIVLAKKMPKDKNPKDVYRAGYTTQFKVKRSDFDIGSGFSSDMIGDDILVTITIETKLKD